MRNFGQFGWGLYIMEGFVARGQGVYGVWRGERLKRKYLGKWDLPYDYIFSQVRAPPYLSPHWCSNNYLQRRQRRLEAFHEKEGPISMHSLFKVKK